ncbi:MAG: cytochrome C [Rubrivivax sp. SCN 70-15]|jgi:cytochrome c553|nr:MAG: cytochrome C [Rubrivivax sp. SCN 70-15]
MKSAAVLLIAALAAGSALAAQAQAPSQPDPAKGQALAAPCMACHVADGSRGNPAYPILQGQHAGYIVKQLTEFKAGKRKNAIMNGMAAALTPDAMRDIAAFYASKQAKPGFAKDKDTLASGEQLYRGGNAEQRIPACAGCHSPDGAGIPIQYPRLAGQHTEYLEAQLNAFRSGARTNSPQMMAIAGRMRDAEIKAVADYITGLR